MAMIGERLDPRWKVSLARHGPAGVFGPLTAARRGLDEAAALALFDRVWRDVLEPPLRAAPPVPAAAARVLLKGKQLERAADGCEYRLVDAGGGAFVARLVAGAGEVQECRDLWAAGDLFLGRQLVVRFPTSAALERFAAVAAGLGREAGELALTLASEFADKFPGRDAPGG